MNILFLSELFYPHGGGAELATYLYAKLLSEAKFNVIVVTNRFNGEKEFSNNEGFLVYRLPLLKNKEGVKYSVLRRLDILSSSFMRKLMRWADIIYVPRFWFSAVPMVKSMRKPVIIHIHDYIPICPLAILYNSKDGRVCEKDNLCSISCLYAYESNKRKGLVSAVESALLNFTVWPVLKRFIELGDAIICVSHAQTRLLVKHVPSLKGKIKVIYNPLPPLSSVPMDGDDFGYFGGANYLKGFHILLKALELLRLKGCDTPVVHGTKFSRIEKQSISWLSKMGFLVYGKLHGLEFDQVYRKIRVVVVPSILEEPLPYVVAEALLRGRLVIASRIGGIPELVEGCKGVFLFTAGDETQLADEMEHLNSLSEEEALKLGKDNREKIKSKLGDQTVALKSFLNICEDLFK